jgi:glycerophosphoryl diester phosphodiesterase
MDIRRTADGDIVLMHDLTTGRTCDEDWVVTTKTVDELKTLNAAWRFDPKRDGSFPLRNEAIRIPTLEEVLALFAERKSPGAIAWIDTKDDKESTITENRGLYDRLIELIDQFGLWQEIIIEVGSVDQAEALRKRDSRVRTAYWASNLPAVQEAILYPGYIQIGISLSLADEAAQLVKASGKELQVNDRQFSKEEWNTVLQYSPDFIGTDYYRELLRWFGNRPSEEP